MCVCVWGGRAQGDRAAQEVLLSSLAYRRERELGATHALVADALQQLGWCQHAQFKYAEAEANLSKALRMQVPPPVTA